MAQVAPLVECLADRCGGDLYQRRCAEQSYLSCGILLDELGEVVSSPRIDYEWQTIYELAVAIPLGE